MAQIVSELPLTLESSMSLTRPDAKLFNQPDSNVGETDIAQYNYQRSRTQLNFPTASGPKNYHVTCCENNLTSFAKSKKRIEMNVIDPITGFLSPAGESLLRVQNKMSSFGKARLEPQCLVPEKSNSIRSQPEAIEELK